MGRPRYGASAPYLRLAGGSASLPGFTASLSLGLPFFPFPTRESASPAGFVGLGQASRAKVSIRVRVGAGELEQVLSMAGCWELNPPGAASRGIPSPTLQRRIPYKKLGARGETEVGCGDREEGRRKSVLGITGTSSHSLCFPRNMDLRLEALGDVPGR